jgi:putative nucleotidyltransferase with HDIG domain
MPAPLSLLPPLNAPVERTLRLSEVISALTYALDLTEGQPMGHALRSCLIGMRIADEIGLPRAAQSDLYYALLMKDAGCSTNASKMHQILGSDEIRAKRDVKTTDWSKVGWESLQYALGHVKPGAPFLERMRALYALAANRERNAREMIKMRCERGASIARRLGLSEGTAEAIHSLDELWNGRGQPEGLQGETIPLLSRVMGLAQSVDVFYIEQGANSARDMARLRSGRWFDPALVQAFLSVEARGDLWPEVDRAHELVPSLEVDAQVWEATESVLDRVCMAFADIIDAKSPFTYRHSTGVAGAAVAIGQTLGVSASELYALRRAALLHDIGKLSVPNSILDKPGKLDAAEWEVVKNHPMYSYEILRRAPGLTAYSEIAASHHEKLDGTGYFRGYGAEQLSRQARILVIADIFDALHAKRPYRDALPAEKVLSIMEADVPRALDPECFEALRASHAAAGSIAGDLLRLSHNIDEHQEPTAAAEPARGRISE